MEGTSQPAHLVGPTSPVRGAHLASTTRPLPVPDVRRRRAPRHGPILAPVQQPYGGPSNPSSSERRRPPQQAPTTRSRRAIRAQRAGGHASPAVSLSPLRIRSKPPIRCAPIMAPPAQPLVDVLYEEYRTTTPCGRFTSPLPLQGSPLCTAHSPTYTHDDTHALTGTS